MSEECWYFAFNNERQGPTSTEDLQQRFASRSLPLSTLVWRPGMSDWEPAERVSALVAAVPGEPVATSLTSPAALGGSRGSRDHFQRIGVKQDTSRMDLQYLEHPTSAQKLVRSEPESPSSATLIETSPESALYSDASQAAIAGVRLQSEFGDGFGLQAGGGNPYAYMLKPHPWHRVLARSIDCGLCIGLPMTFLSIIIGMNLSQDASGFVTLLGIRYVTGVILPLVIEALIIGTFGTTVGKDLLGIRLIDVATGRKPTYGKAFQRTFFLYLHTGAFFCVLPLIGTVILWIFQSLQYEKLMGADGITSYDRRCGILYEHTRNSPK